MSEVPPNTEGLVDGEAVLETVIEPSSGWRLLGIGELWHHRELLFFLVWRDVKVRYKQTALGAAWAILQPTLMMLVFTVILGGLARVSSGPVPYPVFVYAGLLPWMFFASAISNASVSIVESERLVTKVYFPRLAIPIAAASAALVDFCIACCVLFAIMVYFSVTFTWTVLLVPPLAGLTLLAAVGVGSFLAALNVRYRDVRFTVPFFIQLWMFGTPSIYMIVQPPGNIDPQQANVPLFVHYLLHLNPMTGLIAFFRAALLGLELPLPSLAYSGSAIVVALILGCLYFRKVEPTFADVI